MKNPTLLAGLAIVLSLVALVGMLLDGKPTQPTEPGTAMPRVGTDAELLAQLEGFESELRDLRNRLAMLEALPEDSMRMPALEGVTSKEEFEALKDDVEQALAVQGGLPPESPEFQARVAETIDRIRQEEAAEKVHSQHQRRVERVGETVAKLSDWLELSPDQADSMQTALLARYERQAALALLWQSTGDTQLAGAEKQADHEAFQADLTSILSAEQLEAYNGEMGSGGK